MPVICEKIEEIKLEKAESGATFLKLENGLTLIHQEIPTTAVVSVDIWVQAGTTSEPEEWAGMAHFLEHMIFKGTQNILPGEFDIVIESQGGIANAATSLDYTHFMFTTAANHFSLTLPYLADMLLNASIPDDEFDQERQVVIEEIRQALDDPDWLAYQQLMETVYENHPYSRSVLGSVEVLEQLTPAQMRAYHRHHYHPKQMTVAIVGAIAQAEAVEIVSAAFEHRDAFVSLSMDATIAASQVHAPMNVANDRPKAKVNITGIRRHQEQLPRLQHSRLTMAWLGASVDSLEDALCLELISVILAEGRSSRLVRELREELGWVQDIGSGFTMQKEPGLFTISAYLDDSYLEPVEHKILHHVAQLSTTLVTDAELDRAKRSLCNNFAFSLESPNQLASFLGYHGLLGCEDLCANWATIYCDLIRRVQPSDIKALAQKYLSPEHYAIASLIPI
ncbi:pitrilysin family protein [Tumidithrix helvetica PCC 7403]|uniref:M16 family metallopeptidase n=1 Tax=Tumidithrix helvetica TaxID=3457545 RepID=UPI003C992920